MREPGVDCRRQSQHGSAWSQLYGSLVVLLHTGSNIPQHIPNHDLLHPLWGTITVCLIILPARA